MKMNDLGGKTPIFGNTRVEKTWEGGQCPTQGTKFTLQDLALRDWRRPV